MVGDQRGLSPQAEALLGQCAREYSGVAVVDDTRAARTVIVLVRDATWDILGAYRGRHATASPSLLRLPQIDARSGDADSLCRAAMLEADRVERARAATRGPGRWSR